MELIKWIEKNGKYERSIADIAAQIIMAYIYSGQGKGCISLQNYSALDCKFSNKESRIKYCDVSFSENVSGYDENIYPVPDSSDTESGDVFCLGLMLYRIFTGSYCDLINAQFMLNMDMDKPLEYISIPENSKDSFVWKLISAMSDLNTETRPSMLKCLEMIIGEYEGSSRITFTEKATLNKIGDDVILPLREPVTEYAVNEHYSFGKKGYLPVQKSTLRIPYRAAEGSEFQIMLISEDIDTSEGCSVSQLSEKLSIGIDFGTWSSSVSYIDETGKSVDMLVDGQPVFPSVICFLSKDKCLFGNAAVEKLNDYPAASADCFKRRIENNESITVTAVSGEVIELYYFDAAVKFFGFIAGKCNEFFGERMKDASISVTVPACYDAGMKTAIFEAASKNGLSVSLLSEPEAAAIYFRRNNFSGEITSAVLDVGGGTTDVSILKTSASDEKVSVIKSVSVGGLGDLGGVDLTAVVEKMIESYLVQKYNVDISEANDRLSDTEKIENKKIINRLAEKLKCRLTFEDSAKDSIRLKTEEGSKCFDIVCKRREYESKIKSVVKKMTASVKDACTLYNIKLSEIDEAIIVGGASLTPIIRREAAELFEGTDCRVKYVDHATVVSRGAAVYANDLSISADCEQMLTETNYDIGTVAVDILGGRPQFTCLISAGTNFADGLITATASCVLTDEEAENECCRLYLYRRPRNCQHITSTFDDCGDVIRPIGALLLSGFPSGFVPKGGNVTFRIKLNAQECISAEAYFYNTKHKKGFLGIGKATVENEFVGAVKAVFIPLNDKK